MSQPTIVEDLEGTRRCCSEQVCHRWLKPYFYGNVYFFGISRN